MKQNKLTVWLKLCWMFIKINLLTSSGPASVGLLYKESVGTIMTEEQFIEAVGFSNVMPGSEALKVAMFVGYSAGGVAGAFAALIGATLPPTISMLIVTLLIENFEGQTWMQGFIKGMVPVVAVLIGTVAIKLFHTEKKLRARTLLIAAYTAVGLYFEFSPPLVLVGAGILGIFLFR